MILKMITTKVNKFIIIILYYVILLYFSFVIQIFSRMINIFFIEELLQFYSCIGLYLVNPKIYVNNTFFNIYLLEKNNYVFIA